MLLFARISYNNKSSQTGPLCFDNDFNGKFQVKANNKMDSMPNEILELIFAHIPMTDLFKVHSLVCKNWKNVISFFISKICKVIRLKYCLYFKKIRTLKILLKHNLFIVNCWGHHQQNIGVIEFRKPRLP